jgi:hypothetical protein
MTRLACAFEDQGATVIDLSVPGWRITSSAVEEMSSNLSSVLAEEYSGETYIVYQLFDNSSFMACDSNGDRSLPVKLGDGKYHVPGRLVMVSRDEFRELFTSILPLLRAGLQHNKMLLTPLARYLLQSCCNDPSHITNRKEQKFGASMGEAICEAKSWLKGLAFTRHIKNFSVICPNEMLGEGDRHFWGSDPVHMVEDGYNELGKRLMEAMLHAEVSRKTASAPTSAGPSVDWAERRAAWVKGNDSQVHRDYGLGGRGGHRGRGGYFPMKATDDSNRGDRGGGGRGRYNRGGRKYRPYKPY